MRLASDLGDGDPLWARMRAWAERLPEGTVFTGMTAAEAYGLWLPPLDPDFDRAMLCGSPAMLDDFRQLLDGRGFVAAPRIGTPGHYVFERAFVEK